MMIHKLGRMRDKVMRTSLVVAASEVTEVVPVTALSVVAWLVVDAAFVLLLTAFAAAVVASTAATAVVDATCSRN